MHYTGMAGFRTAGEITWDPVLVTVSVVLSVLFGALALHLAVQQRSGRFGTAMAPHWLLGIGYLYASFHRNGGGDPSSPIQLLRFPPVPCRTTSWRSA